MPRQYSLFKLTPNDIIREIKTHLNNSAKESSLSREQLLDEINDEARRHGVSMLKGRAGQLTMATLEKWLNPTDEEHVPSFKALAILCSAFDTINPGAVIVEVLGGRVINEDELKMLEWAKAYHRIKDDRKKMRKLEEQMR